MIWQEPYFGFITVADHSSTRFIRDFYRPIQPTVDAKGEQTVYLEHVPDLGLQSYIYCYWQLRTIEPLSSPFVYRVVSDGCIDILWETSKTVDIYINGFSKKYIEFPLSKSFNYCGIRFLPTAFPALFNVPANLLTDEFLALKEVESSLHQHLTNEIEDKYDLKDVTLSLDSFFLKQLARIEPGFDARVFNALHTILQSQGTLNLTKDLDVGLSPRQLRRLFDFYVGESPKTFSKIVRFQNILMSKPSLQSLKQNKLFYDLGYFDQAHFIKDFKYMYGLTPTIALQ